MIFEVLMHGKENALNSRELCQLLKMNNRELTRAIEWERRSGKPIAAGTNGYYIATTKEEMQAYCQRLRHRAGEIFKTRRACLDTLKALPMRENTNGENANDQQ